MEHCKISFASLLASDFTWIFVFPKVLIKNCNSDLVFLYNSSPYLSAFSGKSSRLTVVNSISFSIVWMGFSVYLPFIPSIISAGNDEKESIRSSYFSLRFLLLIMVSISLLISLASNSWLSTIFSPATFLTKVLNWSEVINRPLILIPSKISAESLFWNPVSIRRVDKFKNAEKFFWLTEPSADKRIYVKNYRCFRNPKRYLKH